MTLIFRASLRCIRRGLSRRTRVRLQGTASSAPRDASKNKGHGYVALSSYAL